MTTSKDKKPLRVMKFGGTSVGGAERMASVAEIIAGHLDTSEMAVVVSAMGGVTDMLIRAATEASRGDREHWKGVRAELARGVDTVRLLHGQTGVIRFALPWEPLLSQWTRKVRQMFQNRPA